MRRHAVGIVVALQLERRILGELPGAAEVEVGWRGIGAARALDAARSLVERGVCALLSFGLATALDRSLPAGTVVVPAAVVGRDGQALPTDLEWSARIRAALGAPVSAGMIAEAATALVDAESKVELGRATGACAADMESAAVARAANAVGVPFAALRAVADTAGERVPAAALAAIGGDGRLRGGAALRELMRSPADIAPLCVLAVHGARASARLRRAAAGAARWLAPADGERHAR